MRILAFMNQKGGTGKTTTAACVGSAFMRRGERVLFVDLDGQCNLTYALGGTSDGPSTMDVLTGKATAPEAIQKTPNGSLLPASAALAAADKTIWDEFCLRRALASLPQDYGLVIIDTPPALGILTVNALAASDGIIIPAQADFFSLQGIGQLNGTIETVRQFCNNGLIVYGIVLTRYSVRAIISREVSAMMADTAQQLNTKLYNTRIRECISVKEAQAMRQSIFDYAPKSNAAADYSALTDEIEGEWKR